MGLPSGAAELMHSAGVSATEKRAGRMKEGAPWSVQLTPEGCELTPRATATNTARSLTVFIEQKHKHRVL